MRRSSAAGARAADAALSVSATATSAAARLRVLLRDLERRGVTVMDLVRGGQPQEPWRLYPGEYGIFDRRTRCQLYFHAHPDAVHEAGHFHTVRLFHDRTAHVVAISMAADGWPRALFTVNRWTTGDSDEPVSRLKLFARMFSLDEGRGCAEVLRFVNLVYRAFLPEIERLQELKAITLASHRRRHPERDPRADRALDVLSRVAIDVRRGEYSTELPCLPEQDHRGPPSRSRD